MTNNPFSEIPSVRLTAGMYALSKLASAGLAFLLLSLLMLWFPESGGKPQGWPISVPHAVYGYGLAAFLIGDALLRLLPGKSMIRSLAIYAASGLGAGLWVSFELGGSWWQYGIAGILILLLLRMSELFAERVPLLMPVFALFAPLLYVLLLM